MGAFQCLIFQKFSLPSFFLPGFQYVYCLPHLLSFDPRGTCLFIKLLIFFWNKGHSVHSGTMYPHQEHKLLSSRLPLYQEGMAQALQNSPVLFLWPFSWLLSTFNYLPEFWHVYFDCFLRFFGSSGDTWGAKSPHSTLFTDVTPWAQFGIY